MNRPESVVGNHARQATDAVQPGPRSSPAVFLTPCRHKRRHRASMPLRPTRCRATPRHGQPHRRRAARHTDVEPGIHTARASGNGPQLLARYGQNDCTIALGRKSWLFAGSDRGGQGAAAMYSLIVTARMNGVDPQAWLADVLARIADHPASRLYELLPWHWKTLTTQAAAA